MSVLLESLLDGGRDRPALAPAPVRDAALHEARTLGLPAARTEAWKYTSLRALERRAFAPAGEAAPLSLALPDGPRLVFVNGRLDAQASTQSALPPGVLLRALSESVAAGDPAAIAALSQRYERADEGFARLNAGLAGEGAHLRVDAGVDAGTLHLVFVGAAAPDAAWHLRHLVELGEGAALVLAEHRVATGEPAHLANEITQVRVGARAVLVHARVQADAEAATSLLRTDATLEAGAQYRRLDLELGGALARHELNVTLAGAGASLQANGVLLATGRRHLDTRLGIDHAARDTSSRLTWRAIGAGRGRAVFHGGILIRAGADGSEAMLANRNLLLSEGAEIDTQPVLEIHADEVKAAHGATVGQLDERSLFYLRSRGIPEPQARSMLTAAFVREVLDVLGDAALIEAVDARLQAAMDGLA
jgi:Fe-S cluster assembly protein SufD